MKFVRFREDNDWEGETWNFYIPVEGNEEAIKKLAGLVEKYSHYILYPLPISENEVDILVKNESDIGYMAKHNKLSGNLDFSDYPNKSVNGREDPFYKGDIKAYLI